MKEENQWKILFRNFCNNKHFKMNYKNNTPFKLKGSPFKQDDDPTATDLNKTSVSKSIQTNSKGNVQSRRTTTSPSTTVTSAGEKLTTRTLNKPFTTPEGDKLYEAKTQAERDAQDNAYKANEDNYTETVVEGPDVTTVVPGKEEDVLDDIMYTPTGKNEESWEQRSNVRSIKNLTGQSKRNQMRNLREGNIMGGEDAYATYGTDGTEDYTNPKAIDKKATRQAIKDAKKEARNIGPTTDPAYAKKNAQKNINEAKDRHKKMKELYKNKKKEIKGKKRSDRQEVIDQEILNRKNMSKSGNKSTYNMNPQAVTSATSSTITNDRIANDAIINQGFRGSKNTPFKQKGYTFGANKKNK